MCGVALPGSYSFTYWWLVENMRIQYIGILEGFYKDSMGII